MLSTVRTIIDNAPASVAGISISNTHIRYIHFVTQEGEYQVRSSGEIKIPYDVVRDFEVRLPVEFTESLRQLSEVVPFDTHLFIKKDNDEHKVESLSLIGYKYIHTIPFPEALMTLSVPFGVETKRIMIFGQWDRAVVFMIEDGSMEKIGTVTFTDMTLTKAIFGDLLYHLENKDVILTGLLSDQSLSELETAVDVEHADIFQNLIDISKTIPAIHRSEVPRFSVPIAALAHGILHDQKPIEVEIVREEESEEPELQASDYFKNMKPLTKTEEDVRRTSERIRGRKYKKLMK